MTWAFGTTSPVSCPVSARPCQSLTGDAMSLWHGSGMKMYGTGCVHQKGEPSRARADGSHPHARQRETGTHLARCRRAHRGNDDRVRCWATSDLVLASSRLPTTEPYLHAAAAPSVLGDRPATRMGRATQATAATALLNAFRRPRAIVPRSTMRMCVLSLSLANRFVVFRHFTNAFVSSQDPFSIGRAQAL